MGNLGPEKSAQQHTASKWPSCSSGQGLLPPESALFLTRRCPVCVLILEIVEPQSSNRVSDLTKLLHYWREAPLHQQIVNECLLRAILCVCLQILSGGCTDRSSTSHNALWVGDKMEHSDIHLKSGFYAPWQPGKLHKDCLAALKRLHTGHRTWPWCTQGPYSSWVLELVRNHRARGAGGGTEVAAQIWKALWKIWDLSWAWKEGKEVFGNVKERDERYSRWEKQRKSMNSGRNFEGESEEARPSGLRHIRGGLD